MCTTPRCCLFFFFNDTATTEIYTLSLHDALPISSPNLKQGPALFALKGVTPNFRNGQMQQFNLSVQRELGKEMVATIGLVSSAGAQLSSSRHTNPPPPGTGAGGPRAPASLPALCALRSAAIPPPLSLR